MIRRLVTVVALLVWAGCSSADDQPAVEPDTTAASRPPVSYLVPAQTIEVSVFFQADSVVLVESERLKIAGMVDEIEATRPVGEICVVGGADSTGDAQANQVLAEERAEETASAVGSIIESRALEYSIKFRGVGERTGKLGEYGMPNPNYRSADIFVGECLDQNEENRLNE